MTATLVASGTISAHPGIDEQIADLTARIASSANDAALYVRRGELHRIHRDWPAAEADLRRATEIDPASTEAPLFLARVLLDTGKAAEAKVVLDGLLVARPADVQARATRARALGELGMHLAAANDWTVAIDGAGSGKAGPGFYLERARQLAAAGPTHIESALAGLDQGLEALGQPVTLQLYAVELEVTAKQWERALARLDRVAALSARQETWLLRRAEILEAAGRHREARETYAATIQAIEALRAGQRQSRAVQRLAAAAQDGVVRLSAVEPVETGSKR